MADFAGKKLNYVDSETGENYQGGGVCRLHTLQDYTYVICVPLQKTKDFLYAIRMCLEHLCGVPPILTPATSNRR